MNATPNPSINRTCPGKPGHAGYLNVGHHGKFEMLSLPLSLRPSLSLHVVASRFGAALPVAPAKCVPFENSAPLLAPHRGVASKMAASAPAGSLRMASAVHRTLAITRSFGFCMSVVGASRHSAAPGSQSVESRRHRRRAPCQRWYAPADPGRSAPCRLGHRAWPRAMPNPSIERTSQGLRPCAASHVKRWASR
jgi:hypothetical protein